MIHTERSRRTRPTLARRAMQAWMIADGLTIGTEIHRNMTLNWDMLGHGFLGNSIGNIAPTEGLTWFVHQGEEVLIEDFRVPAIWARVVGFATIVMANLAVEAPQLFYHTFNSGSDNPEFGTDMAGGILGYVLMKAPLLALRYMNHRQAERENLLRASL